MTYAMSSEVSVLLSPTPDEGQRIPPSAVLRLRSSASPSAHFLRVTQGGDGSRHVIRQRCRDPHALGGRRMVEADGLGVQGLTRQAGLPCISAARVQTVGDDRMSERRQVYPDLV